MLTILGPATSGSFCDGISRRDFIRVGTFASAGLGLSLAASLRAEARSGIGTSHKSIINVLLPGGAPHQDMGDLKPDAPTGVRGEFQPIDTNVEGVQISELMPRLASMMDKFTIIRSVDPRNSNHEPNKVFQTGNLEKLTCQTGMSTIQLKLDPSCPVPV